MVQNKKSNQLFSCTFRQASKLTVIEHDLKRFLNKLAESRKVPGIFSSSERGY